MTATNALLSEIANVEFDHTFRVANGKVVPNNNPMIMAPEVCHDPTGDVVVYSEDWQVFTGMTGQYSYHGAVMHPSETGGGIVARTIVEYAQEDPDTVFAYVEVADENGDTSGDPIGWAVAYRPSV